MKEATTMNKQMMKLGVIISIAVLVVSAGTAGAQSLQPGEIANAGALFEIGVGARSLGMGGVGLGLADDETAIYYNPAGLAYLTGPRVSTTHIQKFNSLSYNSIAASTKWFGFTGMNLTSAPFPARDKYGFTTGDSLSYSSSGWMAGFGVTGQLIGLGDTGHHVSFGAKLSGYRQSLNTTIGSGVNLSIGFLARTQLRGTGQLSVGAVIRNLITGEPVKPFLPALGKIKYYENLGGTVVHTEPFPAGFGFGIGYQNQLTENQRFSFGVDWRNEGGVRFGAEHIFGPVAARFGVRGSGIFSVGGGVTLNKLINFAFLSRIRLDGALVYHNQLPNYGIFSISARL